MSPYYYMGEELQKLSFVGSIGKSVLRLGSRAAKAFDSNVKLKKMDDSFSLSKQYGNKVRGAMGSMGGGKSGKERLQNAVGAGTLGTGILAGSGAFSGDNRPKPHGY